MAVDIEKLAQLKIYYLFMNADGERSASEMAQLKEIMDGLELSDDSKKEFYAFCGMLMFERELDQAESVLSEIDRILGSRREDDNLLGIFAFLGGGNIVCASLDTDKVLQAQTIWTLINLGYADSEYSENEKKIVAHLAKRWDFDPALMTEFTDTADSILALTLQKEREIASEKPYREVDAIVKEIDASIASMFANIETSISEAGI